jgi:N-acetylglutamate synthase-like GNAT family acetyltransferase
VLVSGFSHSIVSGKRMNELDASTEPVYHARRATLEDLPGLKALWAAERLPVTELEKRFTEFQLVLDGRGQIAGAVALRMHKLHGHIHSEIFARRDDAAVLRPMLWQRVLTVAKNNGLARLWTMPTASFYREQGLADVDETIRAKLPEPFGSPNSDWISLKLKEENQNAISLEKEFEIFAQSQKDATEQLMTKAKAFRLMAYALLVLALGALAVLIVAVMRARGGR